MGSVTKIVLAGGPGAGKTSALAVFSAKLADWGFRVFLVPELATELITGGISDLGAIAARDPVLFCDIEGSMLTMMR